MKNIERLTQALEQVHTDQSLNDLLHEVSMKNNHHWCGILIFRPTSAMHQEVLDYGQIPEEVKLDISSESVLYRYCVNRCRPITAFEILDNPKGKNLDYENILLIPLKGSASNCGCFVMRVKPESSAIMKQLGWYWSIVGPYLYEAAQRVSDDKSAVISKRELECIRWASDGKTSWEISRILNITESTVNFHLANCISKTESVNRQQAIAKCLLQGQLIHV